MRPTSLNLALHQSSTSSSMSDADIESLVKTSSVQWIKNNPQLRFQGTDHNIYQQIEAALDKIGSTETGRVLLNAILDAHLTQTDI